MPKPVPSLRCKYTWHTGTRRYTPELSTLRTDIQHFVPPSDRSMYGSGDKISAKSLLETATLALLWRRMETAGQADAA